MTIGTVQSVGSNTLLTLAAVPPIDTHGAFVEWKAGVVPAQRDDVVVQHAVTLDSNSTAGTLTIKGTTASAGEVTFAGAQTLTLFGALSLLNEGTSPAGAYLNVNEGTLTAKSLVTSAGATRVALITLTSGALHIAENATIEAGGVSGAWCGLDLNSGHLRVGGDLMVGPSGVAGFARIAGVSAEGSLEVAGDVTITGPGGAIDLGAGSLTAGGSLTIDVPEGMTASLSMSTGSARIARDVWGDGPGVKHISFTDAGTLAVGGALGCGLSIGNDTGTPGSTVEFSGSGAGSLCGTTLRNVSINKSRGAEVTLADGDAEVTGSFVVRAGMVSQSGVVLMADGGIDVRAGATYRLTDSGVLSLGPAGMANAGTVQILGNSAACGGPDTVRIESTDPGSGRPWAGDGVFDISDVSVEDQAGPASIEVLSSTDVGNNGVTWVFNGSCSRARPVPSTPAAARVPKPPAEVHPAAAATGVPTGVRPVPAVAQPEIAGDRPVTAGGRTVATGGSTLKARAKPAPLVLHTTSPLTYTHTETLSVSGGRTGATITYTVLSGLCTIAGNVLRAEGGTGMCKVVATTAGTDESGAETSPVRTVVLQQAAQAAVTVTAPAELTEGTAGTAEASGGSTQGDFIFSAAGSTGCQVLGTSVTVTNPAGTCVIRAVRTGDSNYHDSAPSAPFVVKLRKAGQTVHPVPAGRNQEHGPEIPTS